MKTVAVNRGIGEELNADMNIDSIAGGNAQGFKSATDDHRLREVLETADNYLKKHDLQRGLDHLVKTIEAESTQLGVIRPQEFQIWVGEVIMYLNAQANGYLNVGDCNSAEEVLRICNQLTLPEKYGVFPSMRVLTFNHLACCKRRLKNLKLSLKYLLKALSISSAMRSKPYAGITQLNLCAVYSQMAE